MLVNDDALDGGFRERLRQNRATRADSENHQGSETVTGPHARGAIADVCVGDP